MPHVRLMCGDGGRVRRGAAWRAWPVASHIRVGPSHIRVARLAGGELDAEALHDGVQLVVVDVTVAVDVGERKHLAQHGDLVGGQLAVAEQARHERVARAARRSGGSPSPRRRRAARKCRASPACRRHARGRWTPPWRASVARAAPRAACPPRAAYAPGHRSCAAAHRLRACRRRRCRSAGSAP
eukprot:1412975-Prymnesium_polylepis.1